MRIRMEDYECLWCGRPLPEIDAASGAMTLQRYCCSCGAQIAYPCPEPGCSAVLPVHVCRRCTDPNCGAPLRACSNPGCARYYRVESPTSLGGVASALVCWQCGSPIVDLCQSAHFGIRDFCGTNPMGDGCIHEAPGIRALRLYERCVREPAVRRTVGAPILDAGPCGEPAVKWDALYAGATDGEILRWILPAEGATAVAPDLNWKSREAAGRLSPQPVFAEAMRCSELYLHLHTRRPEPAIFVINPTDGRRLLKLGLAGPVFGHAVFGDTLIVNSLKGEDPCEHLEAYSLAALVEGQRLARAPGGLAPPAAGEEPEPDALDLPAPPFAALALPPAGDPSETYTALENRIRLSAHRMCSGGGCLWALSADNRLYRLETDGLPREGAPAPQWTEAAPEQSGRTAFGPEATGAAARADNSLAYVGCAAAEGGQDRGLLLTAWREGGRLRVACLDIEANRRRDRSWPVSFADPDLVRPLVFASDGNALVLADAGRDGEGAVWSAPLAAFAAAGEDAGIVTCAPLSGEKYWILDLYGAYQAATGAMAAVIRFGKKDFVTGAEEVAAAVLPTEALIEVARNPESVRDADGWLTVTVGGAEVSRTRWHPAESEPRWVLLRDRRFLVLRAYREPGGRHVRSVIADWECGPEDIEEHLAARSLE